MGDPLPPALDLPNRITDLSASQHGAKIEVHFTPSAMTTEALPIRSSPEIDARIAPSGLHFDLHEWLARSRRLPVAPNQTSFEIPSEEFAGKDVVIAVRLLNDRGKDAGWSNFVALAVTAPIERPSALLAQPVAQGVELKWSGTAPLYRVYRQGPAGDFAPLGETREMSYVDATAEFGKRYRYFVLGMQKTGNQTSESEHSEEVRITPADTFAPAVPVGLRAIAGTRTVELSWERNTETDLAGYRVFRAEGNGAFTAVPASVLAPGFSDRNVTSGGRYRYSVAAFDRTGNQSGRSAEVEAILP